MPIFCFLFYRIKLLLFSLIFALKKVMARTDKITLQLWLACLMCVAGLVLIFSGFWVDPEGEIHESVLVAFGEVVTFAGALLGVDYSYRWHSKRIENKRVRE